MRTPDDGEVPPFGGAARPARAEHRGDGEQHEKRQRLADREEGHRLGLAEPDLDEAEAAAPQRQEHERREAQPGRRGARPGLDGLGLGGLGLVRLSGGCDGASPWARCSLAGAAVKTMTNPSPPLAELRPAGGRRSKLRRAGRRGRERWGALRCFNRDRSPPGADATCRGDAPPRSRSTPTSPNLSAPRGGEGLCQNLRRKSHHTLVTRRAERRPPRSCCRRDRG